MKHAYTKTINIVLISMLLISQNSPVLALSAPSAPTAPNTPQTPSAPDSPSAPKSPSAPSAPSSPKPSEPTPEDKPNKEESKPEEQSNTPAPTPPSSPSVEEATTDASNNEPSEPSTPDPTPTPAPTSHTDSAPTNNVSQDSNQVGDTKVKTGDAATTGTITNNANTNATTTSGQVDDVTLSNANNGSNSTNNNSLVTDSNSITIQDNDANIDNQMEMDTTTGKNEASRNVGDTEIKSGDANTSGTIINSVNTNVDGVSVAEFNIVDDHVGDVILDFGQGCIAGCSAPINVQNAQNGTNSTNSTDVANFSDKVLFQNNDADLGNEIVLSADSGNNISDNNTAGDTTIRSGDANVSANVINFANNNFTGDVVYSSVNIFGNLVGDILFPEEAMQYLANTANGSGSTNQATQTTKTNDQVYQDNNAQLANNLEVETTTGDNKTKDNTGGENDITTGDTNVTAQVTNIANMNVFGDMWMVLVNEAGNWIGKIIGNNTDGNYAGSDGMQFIVQDNGDVTVTNTGNGAGSTNIGNIYQQQQTTIVQSNTADVNNTVKLKANTGGNSASGNTGGDSQIITGDANVIANIVNFVNSNIVGDGRLFVNVVNVFGSWVGDFITPGAQKIASTNQESPDSQIATQAQESAPANTSTSTSSDQAETPAIGGMVSDQLSPTLTSPAVSDQEPTQTIILESIEPSPVVRYISRIGSAPAQSTYPNTIMRYLNQDSQGMTLGAQDDQLGSSQPQDAVLASSRKSTSPLSINFNVAWLLLLLPLIGGGFILKQKLV